MQKGSFFIMNQGKTSFVTNVSLTSMLKLRKPRITIHIKL